MQQQQQQQLVLQSTPQLEEKTYKKEKQILLEFESKSKDLKQQLNEGLKCLEQRQETQLNILNELQDFFKKRAEVEAQYARDLDKLTKQVLTRHKSEKSKRDTWHFHSAFKLWETLVTDTKHHSKYHQIFSEICSKHVADKFDEIIEDSKRIFTKCTRVGHSLHDEIFKVVSELSAAMKTYHEYQSESKQAEVKLKYVQSQKPKYDKEKSKKKLKQYEKQVEKRLQKYTETKVKAFKARNEYILSIDSCNACISKYCNEDIGDLVDCMDFGFHASLARCIYMYISGVDNLKRSRQQTVDHLNRSIGDLDSNADKNNYLDNFTYLFQIANKFTFEPHKGDEVSQVNAQSLIRTEMEKRFEQLDNRLKTVRAENNEIFKTIEATETSLLQFFDVKNCDVSDLFRDLNLTNSHAALYTKEKRIEIEDYYVEKVKQYTISSNLIARLEARHTMMQKALMGCVNDASSKSSPCVANKSFSSLLDSSKKKIGKSPIIGQPRLFGGKLVEYMNVTKQEIPTIITSCIKAINRLGLHNQGIFRIPGSQLEINQFKEAFEKGEDPLVNVSPREINSVAGVLKLYLRELKEPLFTRDLYDAFINTMRVQPQQNCVLVENLEAQKIDNIKRVVQQIPRQIYIVLRYLFSFLNHLSEFKDENMMDAYNIAVCLAPTLIPVPEEKKDQVNHQTDTIEFIKLIIQNSDEIFSTDCDGPLYEKFDSEIDHEEDNPDDTEDECDEADESERHFLKNLSDDELYVTEAVALFDYKGRSDKEISFRKGDLLAIRGQLSADWWHGSLMNQSSDSSYKSGYIPDKYVALRTSKRKFSSSLMSTPTVASPMTQSMNAKQTPQQQVRSKQQAFFKDSTNSTSLNMLNLDKSNLSDLLKVKESDILDDDEPSESTNKTTASRSAYYNQNSAKFNSSTNSLYHTDSFSFKTNPSTPLFKQQHSLVSNANKNKMNQIEDALASVLDDMKQLDFSTSLTNTPSSTAPASSSSQAKSFNPLFDAFKTPNSCLLSSSATNSPTSKNFISPFTSGKSFNILSQQPSKDSSLTSLNTNTKRPDLVLDLPFTNDSNNMTKNLQDLTINMTNQFISTLPTKVRRKSLDKTNRLLNTLDSSKPKLNLLNTAATTNSESSCTTNKASVLIKEQLHSSSASSTGSSSVASSLSDQNAPSVDTKTPDPSQTPSEAAKVVEDDEEETNLTKFKSTSRELLDENLRREDLLVVGKSTVTFKQPPPPVMKKPNMSEEIIRKLGRSTSNDQQLQQQQQIVGESLSSSTISSSYPSVDANDSSVSNSSSKPSNNLSIRLSNSKATDV